MSAGPLGRVRDDVRALSPYRTPPDPPRVKLDANESPWPLPEGARRRLAEVCAALPLHRYPDIESRELRGALAARLGARPDELVLGVGSDEVIAVVCTALARPGAAVLVPEPSFVMYGVSSGLAGMRRVMVPLDARFRLDVDAMLEAIRREDPALIFLATPNNPTGNAHDDVALEAIVRAAPSALVVIDEAYGPFAGRSLADWVDRHPNVGAMGTLSKIGFAGLRIGWVRLRAELAHEVEKVRQPYDMPMPSQAMGACVLGELASTIDEHVAAIVAERDRLGPALAARAGVLVHPSAANFFLVEHERAQAIAAGLLERDVLVRAFPKLPRLGRHLRVTVGTPAENDALLAALDATLASLPGA